MLRKTDPTEAEQSRMIALLRQAGVMLDARMVGPRLTVRDLLDLDIGDCVKFDYPIEKRIDGLLNGAGKFKGQVIDCNNKRAFIVEQLPPPPARVPKLE
jgi:flagellar motor switch protein FliM